MLKEQILKSMPDSLYFGIRRLDYRLSRNSEYQEFERLRAFETNSEGSYLPFVQTKSIFVHIPKCAGISVNKSLYGNLAGGHTTLDQYSIIFSYKEISSYFKFSIVRNPWDRLASAYTFLKRGGMNQWDESFNSNVLAKFNNINEFVKEWLIDPSNLLKKHHFKPQTLYLIDRQNRIKLDFLGYLENIEKDFDVIKNSVNKNAKLKVLNTGDKGDYRRLFTDETIEIVSNIYSKDIDLLGYDFNNENLAEVIAKRDNLL